MANGDSKIKITLFQRNAYGGFSIENITKNICRNLPTNLDIKIHKSRFSNFGIVQKIKSVLDARKYTGDVNHITGDSHYLSFLLNKKRTIITMHDCEKLMGDDYGPIKKIIYKFFWFTLPNLRCEKITTVSNESKKNLVKYAGISGEKIVVVYNGIDPEIRKVKLSEEEKSKFLENKSGKNTIFHVSGSKSNKNFKRLIEALVGLDIKLIKVGQINLEESRLLDEFGIDYLQFVNVSDRELSKIYNSVDCLVFPSLIEGFGLPIIEAQKCECPVITSNISSMPEIAGNGAILVNPYSVNEIKGAIKKILADKNLKNSLIKNGLENINRFKWEKICKEYYGIYQEILKK